MSARTPMPTTPQCFASHLGEWAILPAFLKGAVSAIRSGLWSGAGLTAASASGQKISAGALPVYDPSTANPESGYPGILMYQVTAEGVAIFEWSGAMQKGASKFGGVATVAQRQYLRHAVANEDVGAILLVIDSPGGTVSGTQSLADEVRAADGIKPTFAHYEDLGASAAYWTGSQARRVTANRSAQIGSLGTYGVIEDSSGKAQAEGVVVHVISTGEYKGSGVEGAPVTEAQIAEYKRVVDGLNALFIQAVMDGRKMSRAKAQALFDGRVHLAADALGLGLIDAIDTLDGALSAATKASRPPAYTSERDRRMRMAKARGE